MVLKKILKNLDMVDATQALAGRAEKMPLAEKHFVNQNKLNPPYPEQMLQAMFGLGCFWGAERGFWQVKGVYLTLAGYAAGYTPNPTYEEVCSGKTGHNEVVLVVYDPSVVSYRELLKVFWESHNPTQGMRQGNDRGSQYRSGIYTYNEDQLHEALQTRDLFQQSLSHNQYPEVTTEIIAATEFYAAEDYHQQYLAKNPGGYCGLGGLGITLA